MQDFFSTRGKILNQFNSFMDITLVRNSQTYPRT